MKLIRNIVAAVTGCTSLLLPLPAQSQINDSAYTAEVILIAGSFCPRGTYPLQGQILPIVEDTALYSLLTNVYGGNATTTFGLPDMRGRRPIHQGTGPGLQPVQLGDKPGRTESTVSVAQMAAHGHSAEIVPHTHDIPSHTHTGTVLPSPDAPDTNTPEGHAFSTFPSGSVYTDGPIGDDTFATGTVSVDSAVQTIAPNPGPDGRTGLTGVNPVRLPVEAPGLGLLFCLVHDGHYPPRR